MIDRNSRNFSFPSQLGILLAFIGAGLVIGSLVSAGLWIVMTGRPLLGMAQDIMNPKYYNAIMWIQAVSTLFMFFLPVYFFALVCYRRPSKFIGFNTKISSRQFWIVIAILILTFPLSGALAEINKMIPIPKAWEMKFKAMEASRAAQEAALININSFARYIMSMFIIALLPGIFEEVCFRGGLQNILNRWLKGPWTAIILTAFIFSIIHISYYGFLVRFALGVMLGLVFYYSASLCLSILFHFFYISLQVTALYFLNGHGAKQTKDIEENFPIWAGIIALVLIVFAFVKFREASLLKQQEYVLPEEDDPNDFHNWITKES